MFFFAKGLVMKSKYVKTLMGVGVILVTFSSVLSAPRNELALRLMRVLNLKSSAQMMNKLPGECQITPLFIRSSSKGDIDLTMLIAYDQRIAELANQIINKTVTPLIFSVSTMPFVTDNFEPQCLIFEQNGKKWFPSNYPDTIDMFPIDENIPFGGPISDTQLHQGVILLPGWFDIAQPLKINYKNFRKVCLLK